MLDQPRAELEGESVEADSAGERGCELGLPVVLRGCPTPKFRGPMNLRVGVVASDSGVPTDAASSSTTVTTTSGGDDDIFAWLSQPLTAVLNGLSAMLILCT